MKQVLARCFLVLVLGAAPVLAQSVPVAEEHAEDGHAESPLTPVFRWINFLILVGGLGYLLRKPAAEFFEARRNSIQGGLDRSRAARENADARMREIESRLASLATETKAIRTAADESARREQERIGQETRVEVGRALSQSRAEVDRLATSLQKEIQAEIASAVVARAEDAIRRRLTEADQRRLVRRATELL